MEVAWRYGKWGLIERYADALEDYIRRETLPWAQHYIVRGRALAAHGKKPTNETVEELRLVMAEAQRLNLLEGVPTLEQALADH